ncbi:MAG: SMC-Scp complex subunit ScpB [PVC group bacterium]
MGIKKQLDLKRVVEAILFVASEPLPPSRLEEMTGGIWQEGESVKEVLTDLEREYEEEGRSFSIRKVANGYQLRTRDVYAPWIRKLYQTRRTVHLSKPALETLAIIAYKQPITKTEIELIRGVSVDGILKSLLERELIKIAGQKEVVGRPYLYRTCRMFLEYFGLNSLADLPSLESRERPTAKKIASSSDLRSEESEVGSREPEVGSQNSEEKDERPASNV